MAEQPLRLGHPILAGRERTLDPRGKCPGAVARPESSGAVLKTRSTGANNATENAHAHYSRDGKSVYLDFIEYRGPDGTILPIPERRPRYFVWDRATDSYAEQMAAVPYDRLGHFHTRFGDRWLDALDHHDCVAPMRQALE